MSSLDGVQRHPGFLSNVDHGFYFAPSSYGFVQYWLGVSLNDFNGWLPIIISTNISSLPLLASSTDNGKTWTYPASIYQNLQSSIASNFETGSLNSSASSVGFAQQQLSSKKHYKSVTSAAGIYPSFHSD